MYVCSHTHTHTQTHTREVRCRDSESGRERGGRKGEMTKQESVREREKRERGAIVEDNTGIITLLEHGHFKGRSNNVYLHWCFVCDYHDTGVLHLVQTSSHDQLTD